jgi:hypothetical protein
MRPRTLTMRSVHHLPGLRRRRGRFSPRRRPACARHRRGYRLFVRFFRGRFGQCVFDTLGALSTKTMNIIMGSRFIGSASSPNTWQVLTERFPIYEPRIQKSTILIVGEGPDEKTILNYLKGELIGRSAGLSITAKNAKNLPTLACLTAQTTSFARNSNATFASY